MSALFLITYAWVCLMAAAVAAQAARTLYLELGTWEENIPLLLGATTYAVLSGVLLAIGTYSIMFAGQELLS